MLSSPIPVCAVCFLGRDVSSYEVLIKRRIAGWRQTGSSCPACCRTQKVRPETPVSHGSCTPQNGRDRLALRARLCAVCPPNRLPCINVMLTPMHIVKKKKDVMKEGTFCGRMRLHHSCKM